LLYKWKKISGGSCEIVSPDEASTLLSGLSEGAYLIECSVSDGLEVASDRIIIRVEKETSAKGGVAGFDVMLYPNPVEDCLRVILPEPGISYVIELMNTAGQIIYTDHCPDSNDNLEIDFSSYQSGVFFVKLNSEDNVFIQQVIK